MSMFNLSVMFQPYKHMAASAYVSIMSKPECKDYQGWFSLKALWLVGGWTNPSEKYAQNQIASITPGIRVKIRKILEKPPPSSSKKPPS